jgi:hypothetical protein
MVYGAATYVLWVLSIPGLALVVWRGLLSARRECPFFIAYVAAALCQSGAGLCLNTISHALYSKFYWPSQAVLIALAFAALYEAITAVLSPHREFWRFTANLVAVVTATLTTASVVWLAAYQPSAFIAAMMALEQALRLIQVGVLILVFTVGLFFHLRWRSHAFGIALAFGLYGALDLLILELARAGLIGSGAVVLLDPLTYNFAIFIWLMYLWHPEREPGTVELPITQIKEWNQALGELLQR